ncbi:MAG TPA: permease-like cell division protein FtsX [Candidatus Saccharimonadales bacterium]|nr:permease-like cell division protein FtsX [Candidatus Saccharimonadales bacterium]
MRRFFIVFRRQCKTGLINFIRNSWLSTAATAIMVVTLSIILSTLIANMTFTRMVKTITDKIDVSVYLVDDISPKDQARFRNELKAQPNVKDVTYISKAQALDIYRAQNQDNLELQNAISQSDNYLPSSFQIKTKDPNKIEDIARVINEPTNLKLQSDKPSYSGDRKQAIDRIVSIARFFRIAGVAASVGFAVISILIIFNTIRMAIFNRRDEIEIMKLIGATRGYIRGPFLIEASLYGIIAGSVTLAVSYTLLLGQADNIASYIPEVLYTRDFMKEHVLLISAATVLLGMLIGVLSSLLATKRYLRVYTAKHRFRLRRKS